MPKVRKSVVSERSQDTLTSQRAMAVSDCPVTAEPVEVRPLPHLSAPKRAEDAFWTWGYHVRITNHSDEPITIEGRHWEIKPVGHDVQTTDGIGIAGEAFEIKPHSSRDYFSGVPMPTPKGGTMVGYYEFRSAKGVPGRTEPVRIDCGEFCAPLQPPPQLPSGRLKLNQDIIRYKRDYGAKEAARLSLAAPLLEAHQLELHLLGRNGCSDFNQDKSGQIACLDIHRETKILFDAELPLLLYNDAYIGGSSFDDLHVNLCFHCVDLLPFESELRALFSGHLPEDQVTQLAREWSLLLIEKTAIARQQGFEPAQAPMRLVADTLTIPSQDSSSLPPKGHGWPSETYSASPEAVRHGGGITAYLERVWRPILETVAEPISLKTLRAIDSSAAGAINNFQKRGGVIPPHLSFPTAKELNDRAAAAYERPGDTPAKVYWAMRRRKGTKPQGSD